MEIEISIIMPCYNAGEYLNLSLNSILNQEFINWELVIVNDGSSDSSLAIAYQYQNLDKRIKVVSKENG